MRVSGTLARGEVCLESPLSHEGILGIAIKE
jgi:hypothetical protein